MQRIPVWIGTSGYVYPDWTGMFYPRRLGMARLLAYYACHFPLVELNFTFYRVPTAEQLAQIVAKSPPGFQFVVKLHQSFTHESDLKETAAFRAALQPLLETQKLLGLLAQFPQRFHRSRVNRQLLADLAARFEGLPLAVEFRHRSWHRPEVMQGLWDRGLSVVSVDVPDIPALFPSGLVAGGGLIYVRFHSRRAESWYEGEKGRYDYHYADHELEEWIQKLRAAREQTERILLLFNNCQRGQAALNAQRMMELFQSHQDVFELIAPFAVSAYDTRQPSLFT